MKKLLVGVLALSSISAFAETYRYTGDNMKVVAKKACRIEVEQSANDYQRNTSSLKVNLTQNQCEQVKVGDKIASVTKDETNVLEIVISQKFKSGLERQTIIKD